MDPNIIEHLTESGIKDAKLSEDGKSYIAIYPKIYTCAIIRGKDEDSHDEFWCYESYGRALIALMSWNGNAGTEPEGWHRHVPSHRRRPDGDKTKEYINP